MKRGDKLDAGLAHRVADWDAIPAVGTLGTNTKLVKRDKGHVAFHKPGSKSGRKAYGKRKKVTKK